VRPAVEGLSEDEVVARLRRAAQLRRLFTPDGVVAYVSFVLSRYLGNGAHGRGEERGEVGTRPSGGERGDLEGLLRAQCVAAEIGRSPTTRARWDAPGR
jgi:hypothetical protein